METPEKAPDQTESTPHDQPTNQHQHDDNHVATKKTKVLSKKRLWVIIAVAVALLALIGSLSAWYLIMKTNTNVAEGDWTHATKFSSASVLVHQATPGSEGKLADTVMRNGVGGTTSDGYFSYSLPPYQVAGYAFKTQPVDGDGDAYLGDSNVAARNYQKFTDFFTSNKFKRTQFVENDSGYISSTDRISFVKSAVYESADMICSIVHGDATPTAFKNHIVSLSCAKKDDYKPAATSLSVFYDAYHKANPKSHSSDLVFGNLVQADGKNDYQNASVFQQDFAKSTNEDLRAFFQGLYYKAPSDATWTFVTAAKDTPLCTTLGTDTLKLAFSGVACTDASGKASTVN